MKSIITTSVGVGLKPNHFEDILASKPTLGFFEIHPENYFVAGGKMHSYLENIACDYPLSFHGVGMSLGSVGGIDQTHINNLKKLIERYEPSLVSEHIAWSRFGQIFLNDLLPVPYTDEALTVMVNNIDYVQTQLGRTLLVENPSTYIELESSTYLEVDFINELIKRTDAKLLLDVNNVYVSAFNHGFDAKRYIQSLKPDSIGEIHLAGHSVETLSELQICIDDHASKVSRDVWKLYAFTLENTGIKPTLIEWDGNIPEWSVLHQEAKTAEKYLRNQMAVA